MSGVGNNNLNNCPGNNNNNPQQPEQEDQQPQQQLQPLPRQRHQSSAAEGTIDRGRFALFALFAEKLHKSQGLSVASCWW